MKLFIALLVLLSPIQAISKSLIDSDSIAQQKKQITIKALESGIPVILNKIPNSAIIEIKVNFNFGLSNTTGSDRTTSDLVFNMMPYGSTTWPKEKIDQLTEKYASSLACGRGIEVSSCFLSSTNDYWQELIVPFADTILNPSFEEKQFNLHKQRIIAALQNQLQNPEVTVNESLNKIYYPKDHSYFLSIEEQLKDLQKIKRNELQASHKDILTKGVTSIVVVSSLDEELLLKQLNQTFSKLKYNQDKIKKPNRPSNNDEKDFVVVDRKIPTAYMKLKFQLPGQFDYKEMITSNLMIKVLDEMIGLEIRTRRSLSYAAYSYSIDYAEGIGVISASTSKPKETLEALAVVLDEIKTKKLSAKALQEYKSVFTTNYYLGIETHASLASSLSSSWAYFKSLDPFFDASMELERVNSEDVLKSANTHLKDFKLAVIFDSEKFDEKWAKEFLKKQK
jgi:zinc protease